MKTSIQTFHVENIEINFFFDQNHLPVIEVHGSIHHSLHKLFEEVPQLYEPNHLERTAQIINFLAKGLEFQFIDNIEAFKQDYRERLETSQLELLREVEDYICDYGCFDISCMHSPSLVSGCLIFFTRHDYTGLPYKVSLDFPFRDVNPEIDYELLPCL